MLVNHSNLSICQGASVNLWQTCYWNRGGFTREISCLSAVQVLLVVSSRQIHRGLQRQPCGALMHVLATARFVTGIMTLTHGVSTDGVAINLRIRTCCAADVQRAPWLAHMGHVVLVCYVRGSCAHGKLLFAGQAQPA